MDDFDEAIRLIGSFPDAAYWSGGATDTAIEAAEDGLGVTFPASYRQFLSTLGAGVFSVNPFAGLTPLGDGDDIRFLTTIQRGYGALDADIVILGDDGTGGYYGLRCLPDGGEGPVVWLSPPWGDEGRSMDVVADNFGSFFRNMVEEGVEVERARLSEGS